MVYPSPYHVGMSSLGFQTIYRRWNEIEGFACERAFLPDDVAAWRKARLPLVTYETEREIGTADVIALSVAYELELTGVFDCLELAGVPLLAEERGERYPLVVMGGPLTFSNPLPLGPFADVVVLGEAEALLVEPMPCHRSRAGTAAPVGWSGGAARVSGSRRDTASASGPSGVPTMIFCRPARRSSRRIPSCVRCSSSSRRRGCSRGCHYCVMRRSTNGGMRLVSPDRVLGAIPERARRVGLVGAAVTDHPRLGEILRRLVDSGREVGISSLRADRLNDEIVGLLSRGGYRAITFASDGASERLRVALERKTKERHLLAATELARKHGMAHVKVYQMVGLPGETEADIDELIAFTREMSRIHKVVLGVSPFVAKRNTPLDGGALRRGQGDRAQAGASTAWAAGRGRGAADLGTLGVGRVSARAGR